MTTVVVDLAPLAIKNALRSLWMSQLREQLFLGG